MQEGDEGLCKFGGGWSKGNALRQAASGGEYNMPHGRHDDGREFLRGQIAPNGALFLTFGEGLEHPLSPGGHGRHDSDESLLG